MMKSAVSPSSPSPSGPGTPKSLMPIPSVIAGRARWARYRSENLTQARSEDIGEDADFQVRRDIWQHIEPAISDAMELAEDGPLGGSLPELDPSLLGDADKHFDEALGRGVGAIEAGRNRTLMSLPFAGRSGMLITFGCLLQHKFDNFGNDLLPQPLRGCCRPPKSSSIDASPGNVTESRSQSIAACGLGHDVPPAVAGDCSPILGLHPHNLNAL